MQEKYWFSSINKNKIIINFLISVFQVLARLFPYLPTALSDFILLRFAKFPKLPAALLPANQEPETESEDEEVELNASEPEE